MEINTPDSPTDAALLSRQEMLQTEAHVVLNDLDLLRILAEVGRPYQVGSVALGLMVWRDIDLTVLCPSLEPDRIFGIMRPLASHPRVRQLHFRNDTGHWNQDPALPDGLYWSPQYVTDAGDEWKMDIWFLQEDTQEPGIDHLDSIPPKLTDETRLAILRIKDIWHTLPDYRSTVRSIDIYAAVLDHGVRTPEDFRATCKRKVNLLN